MTQRPLDGPQRLRPILRNVGYPGSLLRWNNHHVAQLENFRLKVFRTVAEHLNFRKAAEHLFLTQPAVTLQVKALEEDLGIRLFDRAANRVSLTPQGCVLFEYAKRIAALVPKRNKNLVGSMERSLENCPSEYLPRFRNTFSHVYS